MTRRAAKAPAGQAAADKTDRGAGAPPPPALLDGEALTEWHRITGLLNERGLIAELDRAALAAYCRNWARWLEAEAEVSRQGAVVRSPNGYPVTNPYLSVANQAAKLVRGLLAEFGLSPAARARLLRRTAQQA